MRGETPSEIAKTYAREADTTVMTKDQGLVARNHSFRLIESDSTQATYRL